VAFYSDKKWRYVADPGWLFSPDTMWLFTPDPNSGYYVDTVGKNTKKIAEYIQNQLKEDAAAEQLTIEEIDPFTGSK